MNKKYRITTEGPAGNAFVIMAIVESAMMEEGYTRKEISEYLKEAQKANYNHLLDISSKMIDELNEKNKQENG